MKKVRWGVLSTANIGLEKVIPAMQKGEYCEMAAIASQSLERGKAERQSSLELRKFMVLMKNCWRMTTLTRFTFHYPIICMFPGLKKRLTPVNTFCVKSQSL
jgi:hypothetical protein